MSAIVCSAGCKRSIPPADAVFEKPADKDVAEDDAPRVASEQGWSILQITQRWRCPWCERELRAARNYKGT